MQLQEHYDQITALGADALGVSVAAPYQAELLMKDQIDFDLLLDPEGNLKSGALGIGKINLLTYLKPSVMRRYMQWGTRARQGRPTAGLGEPPAVLIVDTTSTVRYLHAGETLGHYPPIDTVLTELERATS